MRFLGELERAFDEIGRNPMQYPLHDFGTRRIVLRRFPFVIVFREAARGVEITPLRTAEGRPGYWRDRLG